MFDPTGKRLDQILYPPEYWKMLRKGYRSGVLWRAFKDHSLEPSWLLMYLTSFYDCGLTCPYTVSLSTALPLSKYGHDSLKERFLSNLLREDEAVWQGATWMTEIKGGSDLGSNVETFAVPHGDHWRLTGDKYFSSNAGAEVAVVAARPVDAPPGVHGVALFLLPKTRDTGELNYTIRRLKDKIATRSVPTGEVELRDSEAYLLGPVEQGIYLILEVLNISRVANSLGSTALAQRAIADALLFAESRVAFGRPIVEHSMLRHQFECRIRELEGCFALAWQASRLLNEVWRERIPYSHRYHLFRLFAHLAKYWTAECAIQTAKWCMEVHGGLGVLEEFRVERWLREAMILAIWEGTAHRQLLDALEVIARRQVHRGLLQIIGDGSSAAEFMDAIGDIDALLQRPVEEREYLWEPLGARLAKVTAAALRERMLQASPELHR
jgi:alkylation response protein AidB-like acyl-CoA dehydrogenase